MVDDLSAEDQIERLKEEARNCTYPTDAATVKKRYKDTALILFKVCNLFVQNTQHSKLSDICPYDHRIVVSFLYSVIRNLICLITLSLVHHGHAAIFSALFNIHPQRYFLMYIWE